VKVTEPLGDEQIIDVTVGGEDGLELTVSAPTTVDVDRNDPIWLTLQDDLLHGFDPDTGERIAPADMQRRAAVESTESGAAD
jgi:multiple sugar transport system ATP-binding protein